MICPRCKKENDNYQTVCLFCGEPLTPGFVMCPTCGKVLREGDAICPRCKSNVLNKTTNMQNVTLTPMYVAKNPFIIEICLMMMVSLGYYSTIYLIYMLREATAGNAYAEINATFLSFFASFLVVTATLIFGLTINTAKNLKVLEKRFTALKGMVVASLTVFLATTFGFVVIPFIMDVAYSSLEYNIALWSFLIYTIAAAITCIVLFVLYLKRARIRTR